MCDVQISPIVDEDCFEIAVSVMFPTADVELLRQEASWLCPNHLTPDCLKVRLGMKSWLIRTGGLNILVDTCIGQHKERPLHPAWHRRESDRLIRDLAAQGLHPEDIDMVMCTHLHADHIGWNTRLENGQWVPTFPNARYAMSKRELDHWQAIQARGETVNHGSLNDSVLPVVDRGMAQFVVPAEEVAPGALIEPLPGHTLDHLGLRIRREGGDALFCGDAIHSPMQLAFPRLSSAFCADPVLSAETRFAMLTRAAQEGTELYPAHFRGEESLRIRAHAGAFRPLVSA